jgi:hypothetical protein
VGIQPRGRDRSRRDSIQIDPLDGMALMVTVTDEVGEVLAGDLALALDADGLVAARVELFDGALKPDAERVRGEAEDFPDGDGDAGAVDMGVVHLS